jgi:hypothetical protein
MERVKKITYVNKNSDIVTAETGTYNYLSALEA